MRTTRAPYLTHLGILNKYDYFTNGSSTFISLSLTLRSKNKYEYLCSCERSQTIFNMISDGKPEAEAGSSPKVFDTNRKKDRKIIRDERFELGRHLSDISAGNGRVVLSRQESDAISRNLARKDKKIQKLWKIVLLSGLGVVALIVVTVLSNVLGNEISHVSKGTEVNEKDHALV